MTGRHELAAIAKNAASSYGTRLIRGLSVLLITPYLFRSLGTDGFGTWAVMFTIIAIFNLFEYGMSAGVTKFVSQFRARDERHMIEDTVGSAVVVMGAVGIAAALIAVSIGLFAPGLAAHDERDAFETGMAVLAVATIIRFPFAAYGAALTGYQRFDTYGLCQTAEVLTFAFGAVVAIETGTDIIGLSVAYGAALIVGGLAYRIGIAYVDRELAVRPRLPTGESLHRLGGFGSMALLADSMVFIGQRMDTLVIAAIRSAATAAPFAAAMRLAGALQGLTFPFVVLLMPMASDLHARGLHSEVIRRFAIATRIALQLTVPTAIAFALFSTDITDIWLGSSAPDVTAAIIAILMCVQILTLSAFPAEKILVGIGRVKVVATLAVIEGVSNIALSIVLVSAYGAIGAALGTLFTSGLLAPVKFPLACRAMEYPTRRFLRTAIFPGLVASLPSVGLMLATLLLLPSGALRLAVGLTLGLGAAAVVAAAQIGPRRTLATLRTMRGTAVTDTP